MHVRILSAGAAAVLLAALPTLGGQAVAATPTGATALAP
ncbi:peptidase, partial [Streptomyces rochei]|nr:peptidase [Streptomyces rochei]